MKFNIEHAIEGSLRFIIKRTAKCFLIFLPLLMLCGLWGCRSSKPAAAVAAPPASAYSFPGSGKVLISWKAVPDAEGYSLFRADREDGEFMCISDIADNTDHAGSTDTQDTFTYVDKKRKIGQTYYYKVRCYTLDGEEKVYNESESPLISVKAEAKIEDDPENSLMLVNKSCWLSDTYVPSDLVSVGEFAVNAMDAKKIVRDSYARLYDDARKAGFDIKIISAYRDYVLQEYLFSYWCTVDGEEQELRTSAKPGRSEHQTGYALDVSCETSGWDLLESFGSTPEGKWIADHCHQYGFIVRYKKDTEDITGYAYEPWHIRYVGEKAAAEIKAQGITLEEYLGVAVK